MNRLTAQSNGHEQWRQRGDELLMKGHILAAAAVISGVSEDEYQKLCGEYGITAYRQELPKEGHGQE